MTITNWPKEDRPREKLLQQSEQVLTDAELLAIFINTGIKGKTAVDIAKELLTEYGGLKKLLRAPASNIIKKPGMGSAKYANLKAALELGKRYLNENLPAGKKLNNSRITQKFLAEQLREHSNEVFACVFMDNQLRLIHYEELFHGTINETNIYPREIVRQCMRHNAAKVILAHNHPSGLPNPSSADTEVTQLIKQALSYIDVQVVDHIVIGNPENFSFAENGLL